MLGDRPGDYRVQGSNATLYQGTQEREQAKISSQQANPGLKIIQQLEALLNSVRQSAVPLIESYSILVTNIFAQHANGVSELSSTAKQLKDLHEQCSELLMQTLLKIDGVDSGEFEAARMKRREAVKTVQMQLDRVDGLKARVEAVLRERGLI
ncbi:hypothetical protein HK096_008889 [Nowakowskiella sp. JEL0078]|nr:hypothetical protein HK096_008889 [Nowakowskiella sp. JEL0078]